MMYQENVCMCDAAAEAAELNRPLTAEIGGGIAM